MSSVTVTETFQVYWNYQVWDLSKGETVTGGLADYLLATDTAQVEEAGAARKAKPRAKTAESV